MTLLEPRRQATEEERRRALARAFEALPRELRMVIGLRYQERCSFAEIAAILDLTEERVQAAYALALGQLPGLSSAG